MVGKSKKTTTNLSIITGLVSFCRSTFVFPQELQQLVNVFLCFVHLRILFLVKLSIVSSFKRQEAAYHFIKLLDFGINIQCCAFKHLVACQVLGELASSNCEHAALAFCLEASERLTIGAKDLKEKAESLSVSWRATLNVTDVLRLRSDSRQKFSHVPQPTRRPTLCLARPPSPHWVPTRSTYLPKFSTFLADERRC